MDEKELDWLEIYAASAVAAMRAQVWMNPADLGDLIAEVRRLREQNKKLDPYGRGVVSVSSEF